MPNKSEGVYIVKRGDTLFGIARQLNIPASRLLIYNPSIRANSNRLIPGMALKVSEKVYHGDNRISRMVFNGKTLEVYSMVFMTKIREFPAISGLTPHSNRLRELINKKGRNDLDIDTDYTLPKYQNVKDAGPIQEGIYTLSLKPTMPVQKSKIAGDGDGWGLGGWILTESFWGKVGNVFGGRFGFFLHHDGYEPGTSGCIGIREEEDFIRLRSMLVAAEIAGQKVVPIEVKYND
jgi:LysM repeat protein